MNIYLRKSVVESALWFIFVFHILSGGLAMSTEICITALWYRHHNIIRQWYIVTIGIYFRIRDPHPAFDYMSGKIPIIETSSPRIVLQYPTRFAMDVRRIDVHLMNEFKAFINKRSYQVYKRNPCRRIRRLFRWSPSPFDNRISEVGSESGSWGVVVFYEAIFFIIMNPRNSFRLRLLRRFWSIWSTKYP